MPTGSVTQANMRLSIVNGTAFCDFSSASVLTEYLGYRLEISDSAGKKLIGYIKAAGTGETLGSELLPNTGFADTTNVSPDGGAAVASVGGGQSGNCLRVTTANGVASEAFSLGSGCLAKFTAYSGNFEYVDYVVVRLKTSTTNINKNVTSIFSWTQSTIYGTIVTDSNSVAFGHAHWESGNSFFDTVSTKQVLAPSTAGVTITSTADGSTYNWTSEESGFNRNDSSGYTYLIQKSLPVFTNQYRFRRS